MPSSAAGRPVFALGPVLVDHCRSIAVVTHPGHQVPQRGAAGGGRQGVPGVAQIADRLRERDNAAACSRLRRAEHKAPLTFTLAGIRSRQSAIVREFAAGAYVTAAGRDFVIVSTRVNLWPAWGV